MTKLEDLTLEELWDAGADLNLRALDVLTAWYEAALAHDDELKFALERELVQVAEGRRQVQLEADARKILADEP